ncbi:polynucleotide adenylyltransferase PcnB [Buchnera aphidicola]|uniref:polynucleotide adenylyltransferase PcnB n=1 Tax=Buchnera aphidicola TaxID=9 RepID=UPI0022378B45|nr:polynucleotide adenylyltransferase PcnB [Buchnera aphidicola]MCW5197771.1 polynucleotide adenylyltransferase PcnB [Buchnera aphidicola (Chaitophorus viminalis)]
MRIIPKKKHNISINKISKNAIKILFRLHKSGYQAYLVGGSVRDLIIGNQPKDFDLVTNATPLKLKKLFKNCRLIGKRFQIAHIIFKKETIEVSTFRGHHHNKNHIKTYKKKDRFGILLYDNIFGQIEEDVERRDLTINALYFNIIDFSIRDYIGGMKDIKKKIIRLIGNPQVRYREDPVRILRVIRFSTQLNMKIEKKTSQAIPKLSKLISHVPSARLFNELNKLLQMGFGYQAYKKLKKFALLKIICPFPFLYYNKKITFLIKKLIVYILKKNDQRFKNKKKNNLSLLWSSILWYPYIFNIIKIKKKNKINQIHAMRISSKFILKKASFLLSIPKKIIYQIKEIWNILTFITYNKKKIPLKVKKNKFFFEAYTLYMLKKNIEKKYLKKKHKIFFK